MRPINARSLMSAVWSLMSESAFVIWGWKLRYSNIAVVPLDWPLDGRVIENKCEFKWSLYDYKNVKLPTLPKSVSTHGAYFWVASQKCMIKSLSTNELIASYVVSYHFMTPRMKKGGFCVDVNLGQRYDDGTWSDTMHSHLAGSVVGASAGMPWIFLDLVLLLFWCKK